MTGADRVFIDTNVLVYVGEKRSKFHHEAIALMRNASQRSVELWISGQIIREFIAVVTRPQGVLPALDMAAALANVASFEQQFALAEDTAPVRAILKSLLARIPIGGRQVYDANIVATMLAHGITRLMTFNTADFRRFLPAIDLVSSP